MRQDHLELRCQHPLINLHDHGHTRSMAGQSGHEKVNSRQALGAGLLAAGALLFTARNFILSREGQVTDRYTKAIEQLGSDKLDVRIGGIYALERVARDSARDHPTVRKFSPHSSANTHTSSGPHQIPPPPGNRNDRHGPMCKPPSPWSGAGMQSAT
jgi:hypothetical protein